MKYTQQNKPFVSHVTEAEKPRAGSGKLASALCAALAGVSLAFSATNAFSMQDTSSTQVSDYEFISQQDEFSNMISVTYCGDMAAKVGAAMDAGFNATVEGVGKAGADVYGSGGYVRIKPSLGFNAGATSSASGGLALRVCVDLMKLAKYLENQGPDNDYEERLVNVMSKFNADEVRQVMMKVAYLTGIDPGRMLRLLDNIPSTAESFGTAVSSGDPVDVLKSLQHLRGLAEDLPMPEPVRVQLKTLEKSLTGYLQSSSEIITKLGEICGQGLGEKMEPVLDEICGIYSGFESAEWLKDAVMKLPEAAEQVVGATDEIKGKIDDVKNTVTDIADPVSDIEGNVAYVKEQVEKIWDTVTYIKSQVWRVWNDISDISSILENGVNNVKQIIPLPAPDIGNHGSSNGTSIVDKTIKFVGEGVDKVGGAIENGANTVIDWLGHL